MSEPPPSPGVRAALANFNYRLFLGGQLISQSGSWMARVAQAWLVLELTDSPLALGTVTTLQFLPILLLSLFAGALADRFPKRRMLIGLQLVACGQALALAALVLTEQVQLWQVLVLALVQGIVNAMEQPLRQALPAELVGRALVPAAVSMNSLVHNLSRILGPALGGAVVAWQGVGGSFVINAVTHAAVLAALLAMRGARGDRAGNVRGSTVTQIREALTYVVREPVLVFSLGVLSVLATFGFNYSTFMPLLARYELDMGPSGYGVLSAALGVGAVGGSLAVARLGYRSPVRQIYGGVAFSALLAAVALAPSVWLCVALLAMLGAAGVFFTTTANATVQLHVPDEMRGRVMGLYSLLLAGMTPPGATATGLLADQWGIRAALGIEAAICLGGILLGSLLAVRTRGRVFLPGPLDPLHVGEGSRRETMT